MPLDSPFPCDSEMILFEGRPSERLSVNLITGAYTSIGPLTPAASVNAIGYNALDGYVYGYDWDSSLLVRVGQNGEVDFLTPRPAGMPAASYSVGTLDPYGFYYAYVPGTNRFYTVDLRPDSASYLKLVDPANGYAEQTENFGTPLSAPLTVGDWAFSPVDGALYGVERNGTVYRIDERSGSVTPLETNGPNPGNTFGSVVIDGSGSLYAMNNSDGTIYRYLIDGNTASGTRFSRTRNDVFNDAALCPYAAIELDYGDAPDAGGGSGAGNYNTLLASDGPRHALGSSLYLGSQVTAETDARQNPTATGDDLTQGIQDDGLDLPLPLLSLSASTYSLSVRVTNNTSENANLYGWIDFNQNGLFEADEAAPAAVVPAYSGTSYYPLDFIRPAGAVIRPDHTFVRLRVTTDDLTDSGTQTQDTRSVGAASDGEVEDYILKTGTTTDLTLTKTADLAVLHTGDTITYTITVTNNGTQDALNVVLEDLLPPEITNPYYSLDGGPSDHWPGSLALGNMLPGQTITLTIQGVFDGTTQDPVVNTAAVTSYSEDPNPDDNTATVTTPVGRAANLSITKTADPDPAIIGDTLTFTVTVANDGPDPAENTVITDAVESDFTGAEYSLDGGFTWQPWPGLYEAGVLEAGGSIVLLIRGTVEAGNSDSLANTASVASDTEDPDPSDNTADITVPKASSADLGIIKTGSPDPVGLGQTVIYTIIVTNSGPSPAQDVLITDSLSSVLLNPEYSADLQTWQPWTGTHAAGSLDSGLTYTLYLRGTVDPDSAAGTLLNTVSVNSQTPDPDPDNNSADEEVTVEESADLSLTKTVSPSPATAGGNLAYTITITNHGPSDAAEVLLTDPVPDGLENAEYSLDGTEFFPWSGEYTFLMIPAGTSVTVIVRGDISADRTENLVNTAAVGSITPDPDPDNNTASVITPVTASADLSLSKTGPDPITAGEAVAYTLTLTNNGPSTAADAVIIDAIPSAVTSATYTLNGEPQGAWTGSVTLGALAPQTSAEIIITGTVRPSASGSLRNTASAASSTPDPDLTNNSSEHTAPILTSADLSVVKTASPNPALPGQYLTYTLIIGNAGPSDAESVSLTDSVPADLISPEYSTDGRTWNPWSSPYSVGTIAPGTAVILYLRGTTAPSAGDFITNTASAASSTPDPNPDNNTSENTTPVRNSADLSVVKTASPAVVSPEDLLTYTITVSNAGPSDVPSAVLTDAVPYLLSDAEYSDDNGTTWTAWPGSVTLYTLVMGSARSLLIRGTVSTAAAGTLSNTAAISSSTPDPDPDNNTSEVLTPVDTTADLSVIKSASPNPAAAGQLLTYFITVRNAGPDTAEAVTVTDVLPSALTQPEYSTDGGTSWNPWSGQYTPGDLSSEAENTFRIRGTLAADAEGLLTNTVSVSSDSPDPNPDNNSFTLLTPIGTSADLSVTKTASPSSGVPGSLLTYTVTVQNAGPDTAQNVALTDTLPAELQAPEYSLNGSQYAPWEGTLTIGNLPAGQSAVIEIRGTIAADADGRLTNTASVASGTPDPNPDNNTAQVITPLSPSANLSISKTGFPSPAVPGETVTYTLTITNAGPSEARDITVADPVPDSIEGAVYRTESDPILRPWPGVYTAAVLAPGASTVITIEGILSASASGRLVNTAVVTGSTPDPDPDDNSSETDQPIAPSADLSIRKTAGPTPAVPGQPVTYTLTVSNAGPSDAQSVTVTDPLPAQLQNQEFSTDGGITWNPWTGIYGAGTLGGGAFATILIRGLLPGNADAGTLINTASVGSGTPDPNPDNNTSTTVTPIGALADLSITKTASPSYVNPGGLLTYRITVSNLGPDDAQAVSVSDQAVLRQLTGVQYSTDGGTTWNPWSGTVTVGTVHAGSAFTDLQIRGTVPENASVITNSASTDSTTPDPDLTNNTAVLSVRAGTSADLSVTKTASPNPAVPGQRLTYTVTVTNSGPAKAEGVTLVDAVPSQLSGVEYSADSGLTWQSWSSPYRVGALDAQSSAVILIRGTLQAASSGTLTNSASVTASTHDPNPDNNTAVTVTPVQDQADLSVTKLAHPNPARPGQFLTYSILTANAGPAAARDVILTDLISNAEYSVDGGIRWLPWTGSYQIGAIPAGGLVSVLIRTPVSADASAPLSNTASVTSSTPDPDPDNNTVTVITPVSVSADLVLSKTADAASVKPGDTVTYRLTVRNLGAVDAERVTVRDDLPEGLTNAEVSADDGVTWNPWNSPYSLGTVRNQETRTLLIRAVTAAESPGAEPRILTNTAYVTSETPDPDYTNNTDNVSITVEETQQADLSVEKTAWPNPIRPGQRLIFTLRIHNSGPSAADSVAVYDKLSDWLRQIQISSDNGSTWNSWSNSGPLLLGTLAGGSDAILLLRGNLADDASGLIENTAVVTSATPDPNPRNNFDSASVAVSAPVPKRADLAIAKTACCQTVYPCGPVEYRITIRNFGPDTAENVTVTDLLPSCILNAVYSVNNGCCCRPWTGKLLVGELKNGASFTFLLSGTVDRCACGWIANTAEVSGDEVDPNPENNRAEADVCVCDC